MNQSIDVIVHSLYLRCNFTLGASDLTTPRLVAEYEAHLTQASLEYL